MLRRLAKAIHAVAEFVDRLGSPPTLGPGDDFDTVSTGTIEYGITMAYVEGQTLQDVLAAACATTAIYAIRGQNIQHMGDIAVKHGTYQVDTEVRVTFHAIPEDGDYVPVFDGAGLVDMLAKTQVRGGR
jgi:hypothetical protein